MLRRTLAVLGVWLATAAWLPAADAYVELELLTERSTPPGSQHDWIKALTDIGVRNFRFRAAEGREELGVLNRGTATAPAYKVVGVLNARGQLRLAGATYSPDQGRRVADFLADLAKNGPKKSAEEPAVPFGLTKDAFAAVHKDCERTVAAATAGAALESVVSALAKTLTHPVVIRPAAQRVLDKAGKVQDDFTGMSTGTALAAALRPAGLAIRPATEEGRLVLVVTPLAGERETWPVGWPTDKPEGRLIPPLADSSTVEIDERPIAEVLPAVRGTLKVPVLADHYLLAEKKLDLAKTNTQFERRRQVFGTTLRRLLYPHVKYQVRLDDANQPFLWIVPEKK